MTLATVTLATKTTLTTPCSSLSIQSNNRPVVRQPAVIAQRHLWPCLQPPYGVTPELGSSCHLVCEACLFRANVQQHAEPGTASEPRGESLGQWLYTRIGSTLVEDANVQLSLLGFTMAIFPHRCIVFSVVAVFIGIAPGRIANAQQGVEILEGLLQDLLRSKVERRNEPQRDDAHPLLVPGERSAQQVAPDRVPPVVIKASRFYGRFSDEAKRLARLLRQDARKTPGISSHLDDVLKLQTRAQLMSQKFSTPQKQDFILGNISALDRDWRTTAYRLNQIRGLSNACRQSIVRLDELNQQSCGLFDLKPQIDRRELARLADTMAAELHHVERDVEYELRSKPRARQLAMQLRRTSARAKLLSDSIADGDELDIIVAEFQQFQAEWNTIAHELQGFHDRHIDRTVEQIHEINRAIRENLRLPIGIDREHIKHLAIGTRSHIEALGDSFSLTMLTLLPDAPTVLKAAQALMTETVHLCEEVDRNGSDDDLVEHWVELDTAWRAFEQHTSMIDSDRIRTLRQEITTHVDAMRQELGVRLVFDRREVVCAVAELEGIAEQAQYHIGQWQRRPGASLDAGLINAAKTLIADIHHLHEEAAGNASREHLADECRQLSSNWSKLRPMLMACRTVDQRTLQRISDDASTKLIRLQTLLET